MKRKFAPGALGLLGLLLVLLLGACTAPALDQEATATVTPVKDSLPPVTVFKSPT